MTAPRDDIEAVAAEVLAGHVWADRPNELCACGGLPQPAYGVNRMEAHIAHVAAVLADALAPTITAREAAAEARGAEQALREAAKEARERGDIGRPGQVEVWDWLDLRAARAAAVTITSEESSSLATRVPQDESQHRGAEGGAR